MKKVNPHMPMPTPPPWKVCPENGTVIRTPITEVKLAQFLKPEDAAFVSHAVNVFYPMLMALRDAKVVISALNNGNCLTSVLTALARAEGNENGTILC